MTAPADDPFQSHPRAGALLTIDLGAVVDNWLLLRDHLGPGKDCGGVVKADGYGLGATQVAQALYAAGCRHFFVALIDEGIALRPHLPDGAEIHVMGGPLPGTGGDFSEHGLIPVLNSLQQVAIWRDACKAADRALPCDLHVDTGMSRLGLDGAEVSRVRAEPSLLDGLNFSLIMSHLACADAPAHPLNQIQIEAFANALDLAPRATPCFANSAGILMGPKAHFQLGRPGIGLYGGNPLEDAPNPMRQVIRLQGKIAQVRQIDRPMTVGYGASHAVQGPSRIATVAVGYADGYLRYLSNRTSAWVGGFRAPLVGRVSMDLITFDVSDVPEHMVRPGMALDLIGPNHTVDDLARDAETIPYEILTSLGSRYARHYQAVQTEGAE